MTAALHLGEGIFYSFGGFKKKPHCAPFFFGEREREIERDNLCMYLKRFVFASALLGGIDLRFYEAAAAAGSGGRHLILSFLEKEGEKARRREVERSNTLYIPTLSFMAALKSFLSSF